MSVAWLQRDWKRAHKSYRCFAHVHLSLFLVVSGLMHGDATSAQTQPQASSSTAAKKTPREKPSTNSQSFSIRRLANMADGAPAFAILNPQGQQVSRVECIQNGYVDVEPFAARFMASPIVMANIIAKNGLIELSDLGPASFDCVVSLPPKKSQ